MQRLCLRNNPAPEVIGARLVNLDRLAAALGGSNRSVDAASEIGEAVGRRNYSKTFELEADRLGAQMTQKAGFDAVRGAAYFTRIPDAGNRFFGTHPRNADRIAGVKAAVAEL